MEKINYLMILSLCLFFSCQSEKDKVKMAPDYEFRGNVKLVTERKAHELSDGIGEVKPNEYSSIVTSEYNKYGFMTTEKRYDPSSPQTVTKTVIFLFDENNMAIGREIYYDKELSIRTEYINNEDGLMIQKIHHRKNGRETSIYYEYDSLGNRTLVDEQLASGSGYKTTYSYDDKNNKIGEAIYSNGKLTRHWVYKYNELNQLYLQAEINHQADWADETTFKYSKKGELLESFRDRASMSGLPFQEKISYQYDDFGNVIEKKTLKNTNTFIDAWDYEYDDKGNWHTQIEYNIVNGKKKAASMVLRKFEYYN